jgi:hypothetical protein
MAPIQCLCCKPTAIAQKPLVLRISEDTRDRCGGWGRKVKAVAAKGPRQPIPLQNITGDRAGQAASAQGGTRTIQASMSSSRLVFLRRIEWSPHGLTIFRKAGASGRRYDSGPCTRQNQCPRFRAAKARRHRSAAGNTRGPRVLSLGASRRLLSNRFHSPALTAEKESSKGREPGLAP